MITRHHGSGSCGGERGKSMELISWRELRSNFDAFGFGDNTLHLGSNICVIHNFSEHYQKKKKKAKNKNKSILIPIWIWRYMAKILTTIAKSGIVCAFCIVWICIHILPIAAYFGCLKNHKRMNANFRVIFHHELNLGGGICERSKSPHRAHPIGLLLDERMEFLNWSHQIYLLPGFQLCIPEFNWKKFKRFIYDVQRLKP